MSTALIITTFTFFSVFLTGCSSPDSTMPLDSKTSDNVAVAQAEEPQMGNLTGHVESVMTASIEIRSESGQIYMFAIDESTEINVPSELAEGSYVCVTFEGNAEDAPRLLKIEGGEI